MNHFLYEAFFIGAKEGIKVSLALLLVLPYLKKTRHDTLRFSLFAGVLVVFAISFAVVTLPATTVIKDIAGRLLGYVFGLFYLLSIGVLLHSTGTDVLGPLRVASGKKYVLIPLVFFLTIVYFLPDMAGSAMYLADRYHLGGAHPIIFFAGAAGFLLSGSAGLMFQKKYRLRFLEVFGPAQILLLLALIKLAAGGVGGFAGFSLIPSVRSGLMKLVHDLAHQTFVMILVPDHPILSKTAWDFIAVLFGNTAGLWLSLVLITLPLILFLKKHFSGKPPESPDFERGAARRKFVKSFRDERLLKSLPVMAFLLFIISVWLVQSAETGTTLYLPRPEPLAANGNFAAVPLRSPGHDLLDGNLHKYNLLIEGETVRLLVIKKPDGTLSLCLDACEVCPPEGYGHENDRVVCLYCKTPIPLDSIGRPGGCNPIPIPAVIADSEIRVDIRDIARKWKTVNSGKQKDGAQ